MIKNIKGTKDLLPHESRLWHETESIIHNFMSLHGYSLVRNLIKKKRIKIKNNNFLKKRIA